MARLGGAGCALLIGLSILASPALAQDPDLPGAVPNMKLIEAGALVIPMDNTNQNVGVVFNIKAYGLVNKLLQNEIPVLWAISATKAKDGVDFTVNASRILPTAVAAANNSFAGGPFIVEKAHAAQAQTLATAFAGNVAVYQTTADVTVDVRYDLRFKPYVGVGNVNTAIHTKILVTAGFPGSTTCGGYNKDTCNWTMVDPLQVNNFACLTNHTDPHRDTTLSGAPAIRSAINSYLLSGGNFIAQCAAVRFFEGEAIKEADAGNFITTKGITDAGNNTAHAFPNPNVPFVQIVGDVDPNQGGSWPDGIFPSGGAFKNNGYTVVGDTTPSGSFQAIAGKMRTGVGGNVFYLGGHDYNATATDLPSLNGIRMFLNSQFVPPTRPPSCGFNFLTPGKVTLVKDTHPDDPWHDFTFVINGPTNQAATLQDPGTNNCPGNVLCADPDNSPAWDHRSNQVFGAMEPTTSSSTRYHVTETGLEVGESDVSLALTDYDTTWECKNAPQPETNANCDANSPLFNYDLCPALAPNCALDSDWADGVISGTGPMTANFDLCQNSHVVCRFHNEGHDTEDVCLETANALGDLRVLGNLDQSQVTFTTAAVSAPSAESDDSIFLANFTPIADQSRWPGSIDHFVQPLPVVENDDGQLVPDRDHTCASDDDTGCLAWDAGVAILDQAPDATQVASDRRIGTASNERRVTYSKAADYTFDTSCLALSSSGNDSLAGCAGSAVVPRGIRAFDYSDSDALTDEKDLWQGMGYGWVEGDTDSENIARQDARNVIRETLRQRTVNITDPATGDVIDTMTYLLGDFFHGSPIVLGGPSNFFYLANDLEGNGHTCTDTTTPNKGYRCFFEKERRRRKVLLAPSNDGQLHAFDAGFFQGSVVNHLLTGQFDRGTGRELFAHIPRPMLVHERLLTATDHDFGIDGAVVADDVFIDPAHSGTPTAGDREWRTVVIGGYRDGAAGVYALDVTQPDPVEPHSTLNFAGQADTDFTPVASPTDVPSCSGIDGSLPSGCSEPYPSLLWEFEDTCDLIDSSGNPTWVVGSTGHPTWTSGCDSDANGYPDLANSWSKPNTGRVLVIPAGETQPVVKYVAIFGGGLDPDRPNVSGNYLYMVDIETGTAIYKAKLLGAVPSQPAAVDTDQNGFLDTIYIGTTEGFLYKVNIASPGHLVAHRGRIDAHAEWTPFRIFDTGGRPIFFPPSVVFEANSGHYAVAFGTGDRQDLWSTPATPQDGRFYLVLDTGFTAGQPPISTGPLTEADFEPIDATSDPVTGNFIVAPVDGTRPGWVLQLGPDERLVSNALTISGLLAFTTFNPEHPDVCSFGGSGKIYALLATNANAIGGGETERAHSVEGFAGEPIVTQSGFNEPSSGGGGQTTDPFEAAAVQQIRNSLMDLFPADCRFGNFSLNISSSLSSREVIPLASIPVCIAKKNWTEHF